MILSRVVPAPVDSLDLDADDGRDRLLEWYRPDGAEWLRINLVSTVDGYATGADGTSDSISSPVDRTILGVIRELSDVVLVGAGTVRAEGYVLPKRAHLAIATASGALEGHSLPHDAGERVLVLCPPRAVDRVRRQLGDVTTIDVPETDDGVDVGHVVRSLRERGLGSIVSEGGPSFATSLIRAGLVDDLCLTTAPHVGGRLRMLDDAHPETRRLRLEHLVVDEHSAVYARWAVESATT